MRRIGVVGCGVVGSSWAVIYARAGKGVTIFDAAGRDAVERAHRGIAERLQGVQGVGRVRVAATLEEAVHDVDYIQESAPERLELKRELYCALDGLVTDQHLIGSSTSGLPASSFTEKMKHRGRCLVVHPINPPHLIPLVELIPAPWTDADAVQQAAALMREIGQSPIQLSREINGFVVNRLQGALLSEAFRLVEDGICSADDVDKAVRDGLGLRWFFMGPFETIDLNARDGIGEYCRNLGKMYFELAQEQADPREWTEDLVNRIQHEREVLLPRSELKARQSWRDATLAHLVAVKNLILENVWPPSSESTTTED